MKTIVLVIFLFCFGLGSALDLLDVPSKTPNAARRGSHIQQTVEQAKKVEAEIAWFDHYILGKPLPDNLKD